jgi:hypothetical protein
MEAMLDHLSTRHGGALAFLRRSGLERSETDMLVERLTEPSPG